MNVASYGVMQKRLRPSPECHAREMRNEKGGLGSNTHQRNILPILPLFALIIAPIQRFQRRVDITVNRNRFGALSSGCCVYQQRRVNVLVPEGRSWAGKRRTNIVYRCRYASSGTEEAYSETLKWTSCLCERLEWPHRATLLTLLTLPTPCPIPATMPMNQILTLVRIVYFHTALSTPF